MAAVQKAFGVTLANVAFKGATYRANLADPTIADPAGAYVMAIEGLDNIAFEHHYIAQAGAIKGLRQKADTAASLAASTPAAAPCIAGTGTEIFTSGGTLPYGVFTGNIYNKSTLGCGFTPPQIQAAYGLTALYAAGYDGAGQTIVILDWCGSPTITADANAFSARYGLPPLNSSNFQIVGLSGYRQLCRAGSRNQYRCRMGARHSARCEYRSGRAAERQFRRCGCGPSL